MSNDTLEIYDECDNLPIFIHSEFDDLPISVDAFRVYAYLVRRTGQHKEAWPSYNSIGEKYFRATLPDAKTESLRRRAINAVAELVNFRLIEKIVSHQPDGSNTSNRYRLTPQTLTKKQITQESEQEYSGAARQGRKRKATYGRRKKIRLMTHLAQQGGWLCHYCKTEIQPCPRENPMRDSDLRRFAVLDHVIPESHGGKYTIENLVLACWRCNSRRRDKDYQVFKALIEAEQKGG